MEEKKRCSDVAQSIVEYFRQECAIFSSKGVETNSMKIATIINASPSIVSTHLRRLLDYKIIVLKAGSFIHGSRTPKFFALAEGHEEGAEWRSIYYGNAGNTTAKQTVDSPKLPSEIVREKANDDRYIQLLREHLDLTARFKEQQEMIQQIQDERAEAVKTVEKQAKIIEEMKNDLSLEAEGARKNQANIVELELQLRQARGQIASNDRRIRKNEDEKPQIAFASR